MPIGQTYFRRTLSPAGQSSSGFRIAFRVLVGASPHPRAHSDVHAVGRLHPEMCTSASLVCSAVTTPRVASRAGPAPAGSSPAAPRGNVVSRAPTLAARGRVASSRARARAAVPRPRPRLTRALAARSRWSAPASAPPPPPPPPPHPRASRPRTVVAPTLAAGAPSPPSTTPPASPSATSARTCPRRSTRISRRRSSRPPPRTAPV